MSFLNSCTVFRNLYFFVTDMESERRDANDIYKIKNVVFVVQLMGTIDLLQHVKNLSLTLQSVNQLPWELEDAVITFVSLMGDLATDLDAGRRASTASFSSGRASTAPR